MNESFKETPIFNYKYALYVFIRGVYAFRMEEISDDFLEILYDIEGQIKKTEIDVKGEKNSSFEKLMGHPSEIIFKYLSLIALAKGDKDKVNLFKRKIHSCLDYKGAAIATYDLDNKIISERYILKDKFENEIDELELSVLKGLERLKNINIKEMINKILESHKIDVDSVFKNINDLLTAK